MDQTEIRCAVNGITEEAFDEMRSILVQNHFSLVKFPAKANETDSSEQPDLYWFGPGLLEHTSQLNKLVITVGEIKQPEDMIQDIHSFDSIRDAALFLCGYFANNKNYTVDSELVKVYSRYLQQFLKVFEGGSDAIAVTDLHGNFTMVNQRAADLFGYTNGSEIVGLHILQIVHPDYHAQAWYCRNKAFETGASGKQILGFVRKDGSLVEIVIELYLFREVDQEPAGFIGFTHEIHHSDPSLDRHDNTPGSIEATFNQARELRETYGKLDAEVEKRKQVESHRDILSRILEETTDIVAYVNSDLRLMYINKAGMEFFGIANKEELMRASLIKFQKPEDIIKMREEIIPTALKYGIWRGEWFLTNIRGERTPVSQIVIRHQLSNGGEVYSTIARDITEQRLREEQVLESQAWYRALSEAAHDMIFAISEDNRILYLNSFAAITLKTGPEDVIGKPWSDYFGAGSSDQMLNHLQGVFSSGQPNYYENIIDFRSTALWLGSWLVPIKDKDGNTIAVLGISRDISAFKQSEDQLIKSLAREKELNDLKTRFISMASHEFRTPLSTILSSVELLDTYAYTWPDEKKTKHYHRIQDAVVRMNEILEDILVMGRNETGEGRAHLSLIDPVIITTEIVEEVIQSDANRHKIIFTVQGESKPCMLDSEALRQIIENLVGNSRKYSSEGTSININLFNDEDRIRIEIEDQGVGIPEDEIDLISDPFFRGRNVSHISGSGLGLTIVYQAVARIGGEIQIDSHPGKGTKVCVHLPVILVES